MRAKVQINVEYTKYKQCFLYGITYNHIVPYESMCNKYCNTDYRVSICISLLETASSLWPHLPIPQKVGEETNVPSPTFKYTPKWITNC